VKRKIGGSEPSMAFRFENVPKEEYGLIPYEKAQLKKAVVEEGGLDRDTAYFTISDGSKKKKDVCLTIPINSFPVTMGKTFTKLVSSCTYSNTYKTH
jgi:hypothetical protein